MGKSMGGRHTFCPHSAVFLKNPGSLPGACLGFCRDYACLTSKSRWFSRQPPGVLPGLYIFTLKIPAVLTAAAGKSAGIQRQRHRRSPFPVRTLTLLHCRPYLDKAAARKACPSVDLFAGLTYRESF